MKKLLNKQYLKEMLGFCSLRDKAIALLQFTSGMSIKTISKLNYDDFLESISEHLDIDEIMPCDVYEMADYLKNRDDLMGTWNLTKPKTGITYITFSTPETTQAIFDYLLGRPKDLDLLFQDDPLFVDENGKRMSEEEIRRIGSVSSHQLRKLFAKTLYVDGAPKFFVNALLGHKLGKLDTTYFKGDVASLKNMYIRYMDCFSIENVRDLDG